MAGYTHRSVSVQQIKVNFWSLAQNFLLDFQYPNYAYESQMREEKFKRAIFPLSLC